MSKIKISVELTNINLGESFILSLPQKEIEKSLPKNWNPNELQKTILTTDFISTPNFDGGEFTDLKALNSLLLKYEILEPWEQDIIFNLFEVEANPNLLHLQSLLNTYQNYEVISDSQADTETLANLVLLGIFDYENAMCISETHKEFLPPETQSALVLVGIRSKILIHHNKAWYAKFPPLVHTLNDGDDELLFGWFSTYSDHLHL